VPERRTSARKKNKRNVLGPRPRIAPERLDYDDAMNANTTNLLASVISGVLGGSLAGVFLAARIAEHTEAGRRRYQARANLLCELATYRATITVRRHAREVHPVEYLRPEKIEKLTEKLAGELPLGPQHRVGLAIAGFAGDPPGGLICGQLPDVALATRALFRSGLRMVSPRA
jgi:hypothetical protein